MQQGLSGFLQRLKEGKFPLPAPETQPSAPSEVEPREGEPVAEAWSQGWRLLPHSLMGRAAGTDSKAQWWWLRSLVVEAFTSVAQACGCQGSDCSLMPKALPAHCRFTQPALAPESPAPLPQSNLCLPGTERRLTRSVCSGIQVQRTAENSAPRKGSHSSSGFTSLSTWRVYLAPASQPP